MATTWQDLAGLNPQIANPNLIYPGQGVFLPDGSTYTVVPGDTLTGIANKFNNQQANITVDPEDNLAEDPDQPDEEPLSTDEEENQADTVQDEDPFEQSRLDAEERYDEVPADVPTDVEPEVGTNLFAGQAPAVVKNLQVGSNKTTAADPAANPLDAYASYTYGLTLFALTKQDYNNLVDDSENFTPSKALISSAGRYQDVRDSHFKEDFYFDSFKVSTVIGMSAGSRGTNAINMEFTIIEPFGMTLLDRIMDISLNELTAQNYLDIPYLLVLEFFGADDAGNLQKITSQTKSFPIKLLNFKIKASVKGSEYTIQAVPFNHGANLESIQALKTRMEITATTVNDFFANSSDPQVATDVDSYRQNSEKYAYQSGERGAGGGQGTPGYKDPRLLGSTSGNQEGVDSVPDATTPGPFKTTSFTAAYNAWNIATTKTKDSKYADTIAFDIDPAIANSKIVDPKKNTVKRTGNLAAQQAAAGAQGQDAVAVNTNTVVHSFEAGTSVNEIINAIIPNSEFFLNQVKDSTQEGKTQVENNTTSDSATQEQAKTLKVWKIVPKLKLGEFDTARNVWGRNITFYIRQYEVYQQRDKRLPKSPPPKPAKRYDYFYTGKNNAIINFDIDFNALYFTASQVDRGNTVETAGPQANPETSDSDAPQNNSNKKTIGPTQQQNTGSTMQTGVGGSNNRNETQNAQSALQSVYTSASGDMINLKLQIIGDPHFIKQDDLFIAPPPIANNAISDAPSLFVSDKVQSLNMDDGEIYCYVTFRTPKDFNDETGMYDLKSTNKYQVSEFSGYYRVLTVDSEFRGGKFTQTLNMIRSPEQDSPNASATTQSDPIDTQRSEGGVNLFAGQEPATTTETPDQPAPAAVTATGADLDAAYDYEPPQSTAVITTQGSDLDAAYDYEAPTTEEQDLSDVVTAGETLTLDQATSSDGSIVPIQDAPILA